MSDMFADKREICPDAPWIRKLISFDTAEELRENLFQCFPGISSALPKKVIVVGASRLSHGVIDGLLEKDIVIEGIFDQDIRKHGAFFKGIPVQPFEETDRLDREIPVLLVTHRLLGLQRDLKQSGFHHIWPFPLLSVFDAQCFKYHPFYENILEDLFENRDKVRWLYEELADEKSKRVLNAIIGFRLTFDIEVLEGLIDPVPYFSPEIFTFGPEEVMIDGGAYNGDSIRLFKEVTSDKFRCVIPFEPSSSVFEVLKQSFRDDPRIRPANACLFSENRTVLFGGGGEPRLFPLPTEQNVRLLRLMACLMQMIPPLSS